MDHVGSQWSISPHEITLTPMDLGVAPIWYFYRIVWDPKKILKVTIFSKTVKGTHDQ